MADPTTGPPLEQGFLKKNACAWSRKEPSLPLSQQAFVFPSAVVRVPSILLYYRLYHVVVFYIVFSRPL